MQKNNSILDFFWTLNCFFTVDHLGENGSKTFLKIFHGSESDESDESGSGTSVIEYARGRRYQFSGCMFPNRLLTSHIKSPGFGP